MIVEEEEEAFICKLHWVFFHPPLHLFVPRVNINTACSTHWHTHDDVIKWKHFPRYWPFVWGIHRSPVNSRHKGQWRGAFMFFHDLRPNNDWVNNREAGDLRRYRAHYDVIVMYTLSYTLVIAFLDCSMMSNRWSRWFRQYYQFRKLERVSSHTSPS